MTRKPYSPEQLDQLALRFLDLSSVLRKMSIFIDENDILSIDLNDRKTLEYLDRLELWAHKSASELDRTALAHRGAKRAKGLASQPKAGGAVGKRRKRAPGKKSSR